jgi:hypothetical protein
MKRGLHADYDGALIALGKMLTSDDVITPRLFFGRVILGGLVSVVAGCCVVPDT